MSEIEAGNRRVSSDELTKFAEIFDVSTAWLLGEADEKLASDDPRLQLAARELAKIKPDDLDTAQDGERLGERLKQAFASRGVPVEYRFNQSRGTATDLTFYVRGYDFTFNVADLRGSLGNVLAHHRDVWPPGQASGRSGFAVGRSSNPPPQAR